MPINIEALRRQEAHPKKHHGRTSFGQKSIFNRPPGLRQKHQLFRELALLIASGLDVYEAINTYSQASANKAVSKLLSGVLEKLRQGQPLSLALQQHGLLNGFELSSIQIAERTGQIGPILDRLAAYNKSRLDFVHKIRSALSYPIIVIILSTGVVFFMMNFIVPLFADILKRTNGELPALTRFILDLSEFIKSYASIFFFMTSASVFALMFGWRTEVGKQHITNALHRVPLLGGILSTHVKQSFFNGMAFMLSSGIHVSEAIKLSQSHSRWTRYNKALEAILKDLMTGRHLSETVAESSFFSTKTTTLIRVAEKGNQLQQVFVNLADQHDQKLQTYSERMTAFLEPTLIMFVAIFVGFILVSLYLPMFQMLGNFRG